MATPITSKTYISSDPTISLLGGHFMEIHVKALACRAKRMII